VTRATNEQVPFKLIECPECKHQICWINPRLPTYCPECASLIHMKLRANEGILKQATAWLRIED
jgi:hypothetical protein